MAAFKAPLSLSTCVDIVDTAGERAVGMFAVMDSLLDNSFEYFAEIRGTAPVCLR